MNITKHSSANGKFVLNIRCLVV